MEWHRKRWTLEPERAGARGTSRSAPQHQGKCPSLVKRSPLHKGIGGCMKIFFNNRRFGIWGDKGLSFVKKDSLCGLSASLGGSSSKQHLHSYPIFGHFLLRNSSNALGIISAFCPVDGAEMQNRRTLEGGPTTSADSVSGGYGISRGERDCWTPGLSGGFVAATEVEVSHFRTLDIPPSRNGRKCTPSRNELGKQLLKFSWWAALRVSCSWQKV